MKGRTLRDGKSIEAFPICARILEFAAKFRKNEPESGKK
jgi:hypothetical protein